MTEDVGRIYAFNWRNGVYGLRKSTVGYCEGEGSRLRIGDCPSGGGGAGESTILGDC